MNEPLTTSEGAGNNNASNNGSGTNGAGDAEKLKVQMQHWQAKATDLEKRFSGIDPDEVAALRSAADELKATREKLYQYEKQSAKTPEEIDALVGKKEGEIRGTVQKEMDTLRQSLSEMSAKVKEFEVVDRVFAEAVSVFNDDCHEDVKSRIRTMCDIENGEIVIRDSAKGIRYSSHNPKEKMSVKEFVEELATSKPSWVKADSIPGAKLEGLTKEGTADGGKQVSVEQYRKMTRDEQLRLSPAIRGKLAAESLRLRDKGQ